MGKKDTSQLKDEFSLVLAGKTYQFQWGLGELIEMQERLANAVGDVPSVQDMDKGVRQGRLKYLRAMIWAGLQRHHPAISMSGVTAIMHAVEQREMSELLAAFGYSTRPDPKDLAALPTADGSKRVKRPRTAQTQTTGGNSTATPGASD